MIAPETFLALVAGLHGGLVAVMAPAVPPPALAFFQPSPFILLGLGVASLVWGVSNLRAERPVTKLSAIAALAVGITLLAWLTVPFLAPSGRPELFLFLALFGGAVIWGVINPVAGRRLARVFAVLAIACGISLLVWGITAGNRPALPA